MSTRRGVGLSAFTNHTSLSTQYASHGATLRSTHASTLATQLTIFQTLLQTFAREHGATIKSNPSFRAEFARMCAAIGVDPLAGSNRPPGKGKAGKEKENGGWWAQLVGGDVGDFYFGLGVRVVEVCRGTRGENGGLIGVGEIRERVGRGRVGTGGGMEVTDDDVVRAVKSLEPLGSGFAIVDVGGRPMIRSIPKELSTDQSAVLEAIQVLGYVTVSMLQDNLNWERPRAETVCKDLLADSLVWIDEQCEEPEYWSPASIHDTEE